MGRLGLDELITTKRLIKEQIDKLKIDGDSLGEEIMARMCAEGKVEHETPDGLIAKLASGRTESKLSAKLLVEAGVSADVIAQSRTGGKSYEYVKITRKGEKEEAE